MISGFLTLGQCTNFIPCVPLYALDFFPCVCVCSLPQDREILKYNVTLHSVEMLHTSTKMMCPKLQTLLDYQHPAKHTTGDGQIGCESSFGAMLSKETMWMYIQWSENASPRHRSMEMLKMTVSLLLNSVGDCVDQLTHMSTFAYELVMLSR